MARLLIRATDNGTWRSEDVVAVRPDDHVWGRLENKDGGFFHVDLLGADPESLKFAREADVDESGVVVAPRKYRVALDSIERRVGDRSVYETGTIVRVWSEVSNDAIKTREAR